MAWPRKIGPMKYKSPAQRTAVVLAEQERHGKRKKRTTVAQMLANRFDPQFGIKESEAHKFKPFGTTPFGKTYRAFAGEPFSSNGKTTF